MQTNKLMINLFVYIVAFTMIIVIIGSIMNYFYTNIMVLTTESSVVSDFTKLDLYFLRTVKVEDISIKSHGLVNNDDTSSYFITFQNEDGTTNTFIKIGSIIYFNKIKLCENVETFKVIVDKSEKESISIEVSILGNVYNSQYVLN